MDAASLAALVVVAAAAFVIGVCVGYLPTAHWKRRYEHKQIEADQWRQSANGYFTVDQHKRAKAAKALDDAEKSLNGARIVLGLPLPGPRFFAPPPVGAIGDVQPPLGVWPPST